MSNNDKEQLVDYRLQKLEEAIASLTTLKDIVTRWDVKFSSTDIFNPKYQTQFENLQIKLQELEIDVKETRKFMYQISGALVVISLIIQLFGGTVVEMIKGKPQTEYVIKGN